MGRGALTSEAVTEGWTEGQRLSGFFIPLGWAAGTCTHPQHLLPGYQYPSIGSPRSAAPHFVIPTGAEGPAVFLPPQSSYLVPLRRINQYTGSPEMTSAKPGQVVAGRAMNKQSTTALAPST
jgi:hypothetical protein